MTKQILSAFLTLGLLACASSAPTPGPALPPTEPDQVSAMEREFWKDKTFYIDAASLPEGLVPPPPAPGSAVDRADLKALAEWQKKRTPKLCEEVMAQKYVEPAKFFAKLPYEPKSAADAFLFRVRADVSKAVSRYKQHYSRPRPFLRDPKRFKPCYPEGHGTAYPSGHAAIAEAYALALSDLDPANRDTYVKEGKQAALYRVIGGVHHPSDIEAGARLGAALYAKMKQTPKFQEDLANLQGEALKAKQN